MPRPRSPMKFNKLKDLNAHQYLFYRHQRTLYLAGINISKDQLNSPLSSLDIGQAQELRQIPQAAACGSQSRNQLTRLPEDMLGESKPLQEEGLFNIERKKMSIYQIKYKSEQKKIDREEREVMVGWMEESIKLSNSTDYL